MPASVDAANPTTVLPYALASAFQRSRAWAVDQNSYANGEVQSQTSVATSRKSWALNKLLTPTEYVALETFYLARKGGLQEFWFYDSWETSPKLSAAGYDLTGASPTARYTVRFDGDLQSVLQLGRSQASLKLIEID